VMAAISALANSIATIFTLDVYQNFWRKNAGDKELIITGQVSGGAALLIASLVAPVVGSIGLFKYFQTGVTYMATPFISVILMGMFWKRTSYMGAIVGLIGGVIIQIIVVFVLMALNINLHWLYVGGIAQVFTMLLIILVSLNSTPPSDDQVKPFIWNSSWLETLNDGVKRAWWKRVELWFALYALTWCYIYWRFW
ncbi:MAG TPA: hypothetical protein VGD22_04235, partial [Sphingobacteriaceae bacterium]